MKQKRALSVIVADDQEVDVEGLHKMIADADDMEVIDSTQDLTALPDLVERLHPDVVILDVDWYSDHRAGIRMIQRLKQMKPDLAIVSVTVYPELVGEASQTGVLALKKNFTRRELWAAIRLANQFRDSKPSSRPPPAGFDQLTARQKQVLGCLVRARTDEQIAAELGIRPGTVKKHVGSILDKLEVSSRTEAAVLAERAGFNGQ
ncbi:MAG TPA: response regulator transcription factor [Anaerolineales bacterium]|nr:response regulator transcription factor [Anaerolineales bacterium]